MATPKRIGGYIWRQEIVRARQAQRQARTFLQRILDERPGPALAAMYLAQIGSALAEIADALTEIERIGSKGG